MIENTSKRAPYLHLLGSMSDGPSGYIEGMERDGQRQVVGSETIPTRCPGDELTALGFRLGDAVPGDPLFRHAVLPDGWKREGSDHAMWSYIVDALGRRRVSVFYKAAFYDRQADAYVVTREGYVNDVRSGYSPMAFDDWCTAQQFAAAAEKWAESRAKEAKDFEKYDMADAVDRALTDVEAFLHLAQKAREV